MRRSVVALVLSASTLAAAQPSTAASHLVAQRIGRFAEPVYLTAPRADRSRVFVVERHGRIRVVRNGRKVRRPFLDITRRVLIESQQATEDQRGLLSMAFAPDYARSGRFYVAYTGLDDQLRVDELRRSSDPNRARPSTRRTVLVAGHAGPYHHGGQLQFGRDGLLYVSTGVSDRSSRAQDAADLHGKLLRIDPRAAGAPVDVFASGLRNPWRFSFDRRTGDLAIGDAGDSLAEEIDYLPRSAGGGANFGYDLFEGTRQVLPGPPPQRYVPPMIEHLHSRGWCAVVGGYVVRDRALRALYGRYVYGDFCLGRLHSARLRAGTTPAPRRESISISALSSFGEDSRGRLYALSLLGPVYRLAERR